MKFSEWVERLLETRDDELPRRVDVIIGIGTDLSKNGYDVSPQSAAIIKRVFELFMRGVADNVVFCGGYHVHTVTEAKAMKRCFDVMLPFYPEFERYLTPKTVILEEKSYRTFLNADYTLPLMREKGWKSAVIVAQQWHTRRVRTTFRKRWCGSGIEFRAVKARSPYSGDNSQSRLTSFWRFAVWDTLAFIISKVKGYC